MSDPGPEEQPHSQNPPPHKRWTTSSRFRSWAPPVVFGAVAVLLSWKSVGAPTFTADEPKCSRTEDSHGLFSDFFFQQASEWKLHDAEMRVHLFTFKSADVPPLQPEPGEDLQDLDPRCASRYFLTQLLRAIKGLHPAVIAIDQTYTPVFCKKITEQFLSAVRDTVTSMPTGSTPVPTLVVGMPTQPLSDSEAKAYGACRGEQKMLSFPLDITAQPELPANSNAKWRIFPTSTTIDSNTLQIPLSWPVWLMPILSSEGVVVSNARYGDVDTFAFRAAELAERVGLGQTGPGVAQKVRELHGEDDPFGRYIPSTELTEHRWESNAFQFLCNSFSGDQQPERWRKGSCPPKATQAEGGSQIIPTDLSGEVAVIGLLDETDTHAFLGGRLYGVELQAEYIQALLTGNYFKPWSWTLEFLMSLTIVTAFTFLLRHNQNSPWRMTGLMIGEFLLLAVIYGLSIAANYFPAHVWALLSSLLIVFILQVAEVFGGKRYDDHLSETKRKQELTSTPASTKTRSDS